MGPTETGLLILTGVAILAVVAFVAQNIENTKRERHLKLMRLRDNVRRADHLLSSFPALLLTFELKKLLARYLQQQWQAILELENSEENQRQLKRVVDIGNQKPAPIPHPEGSLTAFASPAEAAQAQSLLREQAQFINDIEKRGELPAQAARGYLVQVKRAYTRASIELEIWEAIEIERMTGSEASLPKLRGCFMKLERLNHDQSLDRQLYELRTHIAKLTQMKEETDRQWAEERKREAEAERKKFPS
ncbi:hypothetical protein [Marinobacterium arenosum]|uniref:hypothetical protein n=1 Tax=Marinobacterium arenosum TaxID=2862496 RepID=UPI001C967B1E|nr:hypothetical protein [Marinobacterium arenosum]MBY4675437.1 hypothetical protein [Marinobacterium arenosum]